MAIDVGQISSFASSLKVAGDIAKAMMDLRDATAFQTKALELTREIMAAQSSALAAQTAQFALLEKIRELETKVAQSIKWESEKEKYELKELERGAFAYVHKVVGDQAEPLHAICPACYQNGKKSLLQSNGATTWDRHHFHCPSCKTIVKTRSRDLAKLLTPSSDGLSLISWIGS